MFLNYEMSENKPISGLRFILHSLAYLNDILITSSPTIQLYATQNLLFLFDFLKSLRKDIEFV